MVFCAMHGSLCRIRITGMDARATGGGFHVRLPATEIGSAIHRQGTLRGTAFPGGKILDLLQAARRDASTISASFMPEDKVPEDRVACKASPRSGEREGDRTPGEVVGAVVSGIFRSGDDVAEIALELAASDQRIFHGRQRLNQADRTRVLITEVTRDSRQ